MHLITAMHLQILPALAAAAGSTESSTANRTGASGAPAIPAIATPAGIAPAAIHAAHAAWLPRDRRGLLHDRERLLRWRPHLDDERVQCRRHGARPVRQDCI